MNDAARLVRGTVDDAATWRAIERWLRRDQALHAYELADLSPELRPSTAWWLSERDGAVDAALLLFDPDTERPTLLAVSERATALLERVLPALPTRLYAHAAPGPSALLASRYRVLGRSSHLKLVLDLTLLPGPSTLPIGAQLAPLRMDDQAEVIAFYERAYPEHWFAASTLETGFSFGIRIRGELVAIAGVHAVSRPQRVAAVGNVATDPGHRGHGFGSITTRATCVALLEAGVETIALNVSEDNTAALRAYERLGFRHVAPYEELDLFAPTG